MVTRVFTIIIAVSCSFLWGCATPTKMAFAENPEGTNQQLKTPVYLMTATIRNTYRSSFQPKLLVTHVERSVVKDSADRISFTMDSKSKNESNSPAQGSSYLLHMGLEPGEYVIRGLSSLARSFPINGFFFTPLHVKVVSSKQGVFYLGHVEATVRERNDDIEFKAGPSIPLIDQAIAGASTGSFDVVISDQWEKDEAMFRDKFAALNGVTVEKAILPPFDRENAQKWWLEN